VVEKEGRERKQKGMMLDRIKVEEEVWRIMRIYVRGDMEKKLEGMRE